MHLYEKYIAHRPKELNPQALVPTCIYAPLIKVNGVIWYSCQPPGLHSSTTTMKRMCEKS